MAGVIRFILFAAVLAVSVLAAQAHDWYPSRCCSGFDCRKINPDDVVLTPQGFLIKENGETVPYNSERIIKTPPEGQGLYHRCSQGGTAQGKTICLYIPNWGS